MAAASGEHEDFEAYTNIFVKEWWSINDWNDALRAVCRGCGCFETYAHIFDVNGIVPTVDNNYCVRWASRNGFIDIVKDIIENEHADVKACDNYCIKWSSANGHLEIVKCLSESYKAMHLILIIMD